MGERRENNFPPLPSPPPPPRTYGSRFLLSLFPWRSWYVYVFGPPLMSYLVSSCLIFCCTVFALSLSFSRSVFGAIPFSYLLPSYFPLLFPSLPSPSSLTFYPSPHKKKLRRKASVPNPRRTTSYPRQRKFHMTSTQCARIDTRPVSLAS